MGDCEAPSDHQVASDCEDRSEGADADTGGTQNEQVHVQLLLSQQALAKAKTKKAKKKKAKKGKPVEIDEPVPGSQFDFDCQAYF